MKSIAPGRLRPAFETAQRAFENLNDRERRAVSLLLIVFCAMILGAPLVLISSRIADLEHSNSEMRELLQRMDAERPELLARRAEQRAAQRRYERKAPPLASFVEGIAKSSGLTIREVTDQPERQLRGFVRRNVRVALPGVSLKPVVEMMVTIENSDYPVTLERIHIDHFHTGDKYNAELGLAAYDRSAGTDRKGTKERRR